MLCELREVLGGGGGVGNVRAVEVDEGGVCEGSEPGDEALFEGRLVSAK